MENVGFTLNELKRADYESDRAKGKETKRRFIRILKVIKNWIIGNFMFMLVHLFSKYFFYNIIYAQKITHIKVIFRSYWDK